MHGRLPIDETRPDPDQMRIWNRLDASARIALVDELRAFAIESQRAQVRRRHPDWDAATVERAVRRWFLCGSTGEPSSREQSEAPGSALP